eukprot:CAMPEP_0198137358 /NCGR_PEP_ID=MMETSP1443-20131203/862_1 /TAXON_ID=186043 /ORGANISM="Entomoneis sp., Strain CCMP2396" /LENGTH=104 /DNA_ID=CAMNT_0043798763 /DNA_START=116 /DNA_END=431 /DNA_ORIENTATION=+
MGNDDDAVDEEELIFAKHAVAQTVPFTRDAMLWVFLERRVSVAATWSAAANRVLRVYSHLAAWESSLKTTDAAASIPNVKFAASCGAPLSPATKKSLAPCLFWD